MLPSVNQPLGLTATSNYPWLNLSHLVGSNFQKLVIFRGVNSLRFQVGLIISFLIKTNLVISLK